MFGRFHARVAAAALLAIGFLSSGAMAGLCPTNVAQGPPTNIRDQVMLDVFHPAELAGILLNEYPYVEYTLAFNQGTRVFFALDPTQHSAVAGQTVDLYIADDRSEAEWLADGTLTDVRGAPQTATLGVSTIQSSTIFLTGSNQLPGAAGTGLGVPYDVVCDVNRNGELDEGDFIDGFGDGGFYVVHDLTQPGPLAVTEITYSVAPGSVTPGFESENLFYPTDVGTLGQLPLIVVGHGNGHQYTWYDHIGLHLASYGYIVMSHRNNTGPGVQSAAITTLEHTDAFLGQLAAIAGGVLQGHVDTNRIVWIGHSRGGEGIAIAYDRIHDGTWSPVNYDLGDIVLLSSIAPVDFEGPANTDPHGAVFSLWTGGADDDVNGCAESSVAQTFHLHDRALRWRQSISLHGVGHADFHNGGGSSVASGPCLVGRTDTHRIMRGYLLPLVKHYVENNVPARDFLWRQWEAFRPIGAPVENACVTVDLMFREDPAANFVVDNFQTQSATSTSSSGGPVTFSVIGVSEGRLDDSNTVFTHNVGDAMNGMTAAGSQDSSRGIVFEWISNYYYEQGIVPGERDLTDDRYLTFRACQGTRHPHTTAASGDLTFTVTLVDGSLGTSSIRINAYGGGIEEPYARSGCGNGSGWNNEFETIRIRLTDFLTNGSGLDLSDVTAIRFEFGPGHGSPVGRIGLDEITISSDPAQPIAGALAIALAGGMPPVEPYGGTNIMVRISAGSEHLVPDTAAMHYRFAGGTFTTVPLSPAGPDRLFSATLPAAGSADELELYFSAEGTRSGRVTLPQDAPGSLLRSASGTTKRQDGDAQ